LGDILFSLSQKLLWLNSLLFYRKNCKGNANMISIKYVMYGDKFINIVNIYQISYIVDYVEYQYYEVSTDLIL
jgi:hypothetical protein